MKKIHYWEKDVRYFLQKHQILIIMKLTVILICLFSLSVQATVYSQSAKVNLNLKEVSLKEVFKIIEKQTPCRFFYNDQFVDLDSKVSFKANDVSVDEVLNIILKNANVTHKVLENNLVVIAPIDNQAKSTITGTVTDAKTGELLPGVGIFIKGTTKAAITDRQGKFSIISTNPNATLVFSFIGYDTQEINLNGRQNITVALVPSIKNLDEVVVIGYGTTKKKDLTGSVMSVSSNDFKARPVQNLSDMIQGRAAGVTVTSLSGDAAATTKVRIRGNNSINGDNAPLYVVDGVPMGSYNPNDVASIEILKDASATAIYGSRGANGVVLITTKRGKVGAPTVELSVTQGFSNAQKSLNLMDAAEYAEFYNKYTGTSYFTADQISNFKAKGGTDWQKAIMQTGISQNYQGSVSGGSETAKYFIAGNYINNSATLKNNNANSYGIRSNVDLKIGNRFTATIDIAAHSSKVLNAGTGSTIDKYSTTNALMWSPTAPIYNADGSYNILDPIGSKSYNPYMLAIERNVNQYNTNVSANGIFAYNIIDGLKISVQPAIEKSSSELRKFENQYVITQGYPGATRGCTEDITWQITGLLTYDKVFKEKHALNIVLGSEVWSNKNNNFSAYSSNFSDNSVLWYSLQSGTDQSTGSGYTESSLASYFARANYIFNSKYYLTASMRADGSSKFRGNNQFGYFPAVAAGWLASEEGFIKDLNFFDHLKLRGSWGITGSQAISPYSTNASMSSYGYNYGTTTNYPGYIISSPANPGLKWEKTAQSDIGLDATLLKNKLSVTLDYFNKHTTDLLTAKPLPWYSGGGTTMINLGEMANSGFDGSITYIPITTKSLQWTTTFNLSILHNKVIDLGDLGTEFIPSGSVVGVELSNSPMIVREGARLGSFYGYKFFRTMGDKRSD